MPSERAEAEVGGRAPRSKGALPSPAPLPPSSLRLGGGICQRGSSETPRGPTGSADLSVGPLLVVVAARRRGRDLLTRPRGIPGEAAMRVTQLPGLPLSFGRRVSALLPAHPLAMLDGLKMEETLQSALEPPPASFSTLLGKCQAAPCPGSPFPGWVSPFRTQWRPYAELPDGGVLPAQTETLDQSEFSREWSGTTSSVRSESGPSGLDPDAGKLSHSACSCL